jgi:hypothetical protein
VASGEIVLFTDDDAMVHDGWIDALCGAFEQEIGAVGGRVLPMLVGSRPAWLADFKGVPLTLWDWGTAPFEMRGSELPLGVNMAVRRQLLVDLEEPFDVRLGHRAGASIGYEETHLIRQIGGSHRIVYEPTAVVDHIIDGDRLSYGAVRRSFFQTGFGRARHERLAGKEDARPHAQRFRAAAHAYGLAVLLRWRNSRRQPSPASAREEFSAYLHGGEQIEMLLAGAPRAAEWCARRLAI